MYMCAEGSQPLNISVRRAIDLWPDYNNESTGHVFRWQLLPSHEQKGPAVLGRAVSPGGDVRNPLVSHPVSIRIHAYTPRHVRA